MDSLTRARVAAIVTVLTGLGRNGISAARIRLRR
jgi:hypothetical protein